MAIRSQTSLLALGFPGLRCYPVIRLGNRNRWAERRWNQRLTGDRHQTVAPAHCCEMQYFRLEARCVSLEALKSKSLADSVSFNLQNMKRQRWTGGWWVTQGRLSFVWPMTQIWKILWDFAFGGIPAAPGSVLRCCWSVAKWLGCC